MTIHLASLFFCFLFPLVVAFTPAPGYQRSTQHLFFKQREGNRDNNTNVPWWSSFKNRMAVLFGQPQPDAGNRYHIRIRDIGDVNRRHVVTRLLRFFPDLTYETASDIVDTALVNKVALVRITNSKEEAAFATDMLNKAHPTDYWNR